jgi:hypothetical protein
VPRAVFRAYGELNFFLPEEKRGTAFQKLFQAHETVKHILEAIGIPHPEVSLLLINGKSCGFDAPVHDQDRVSVYPPFQVLQVDRFSKVPTIPEGAKKFLLDSHLGKLAKNLRLLGFDTRYQNDYSDPELSELSWRENRILLTRDRGLLKRKQVRWGYLVREDDPWEQTISVVMRYNLAERLQPFTRCARCNGRLEKVDKGAVLDQLEPLTRKYYQDFSRCRACGQVYWKGSHFDRLTGRVNQLKMLISEKDHKL